MDNKKGMFSPEAVDLSFKTATSFDELYEMIRGVGDISDKNMTMTADMIIDYIKKGNFDILPDIFDIRETAKRLSLESLQKAA